jgi:4-methyl-5(b-hydroxyethyl)-thiazole monophosphate biosynthesis
MKTALIPIADGTEELEAVSIIDLLRRADIHVTVASIMQNKLEITASRGVHITADTAITDCTEQTFDLIAIPGGMPGAEHIRDCEPFISILKNHINKQRCIGAICAAPAVVLTHHGLLSDKKATCFPAFSTKLQSFTGERVTVDDTIITSQGAGTAIEFTLELINKICGKEKMTEIKKSILA